MFTGTAAFSAETPVALALKQIRERPQPPRRIAPQLPVHVEQAILKCLEKDPADRFQSVEDLLCALEGKPFPTARKRGLRPWLLGALAAILAAAVVFYRGSQPGSPPAQPTHRQITFVGDAADPAISPDGKSIAYVTGKEGQEPKLMVQDVKGGEAIELSKDFARPRWSPDGSELAVVNMIRGPHASVAVIPRLGGNRGLSPKGSIRVGRPMGVRLRWLSKASEASGSLIR